MPDTQQLGDNTHLQQDVSDNSFATEDARWTATVERNSCADGQFVYAVTTTGIYCRPTCPARKPHRKNVVFFASCEDARFGGFRPCKRCSPDGVSAEERNAEIVAATCRKIESEEAIPSLQELADTAGLSQHHFHRLFRSLTGVTAQEYAQAHRKAKVKRELRESPSVTEAIYNAGFQSSGRFYSESSASLGMTPSAFRSDGAGETIQFAVGECTLGSILIAATNVGVCSIALGDSAEALMQQFQDEFSKANLVGGDEKFEHLVSQVVGFVESPSMPLQLPLDIRGTLFQLKVWKALQTISPGDTLTYTELAEKIGKPSAVRAVASACGKNRIALAIPCHRIVRADATLSGYRWGIERKKALLERESKLKPTIET